MHSISDKKLLSTLRSFSSNEKTKKRSIPRFFCQPLSNTCLSLGISGKSTSSVALNSISFSSCSESGVSASRASWDSFWYFTTLSSNSYKGQMTCKSCINHSYKGQMTCKLCTNHSYKGQLTCQSHTNHSYKGQIPCQSYTNHSYKGQLTCQSHTNHSYKVKSHVNCVQTTPTRVNDMSIIYKSLTQWSNGMSIIYKPFLEKVK